MIKGTCDFMSGSYSLHITTLPSLVAISIAVGEIVFSFSRDLASPWIVAPQSKSSSGKFGDHSHCDSEYNGFSLSRDLRRPPDQMVMCFYG